MYIYTHTKQHQFFCRVCFFTRNNIHTSLSTLFSYNVIMSKLFSFQVIHSKIEDFVLPSSAEKVDVIISEWMGFYLLHEGMLDSVLFARDNFLKPEGVLFPSEATIYIAPCAVPHLFDDWNEYDGVCLNSFAAMLRQQKSSKPEIAIISPNDLLHEGAAMHWMSLKDVTSNDIDNIDFQEVLAARKSGKHQGFCIWFDCKFPTDSFEEAIVLSTSPNSPSTHWKQCIVVLPVTSCEELDEGDPISFKIVMRRNSENTRNYGIEVEILDPNEVEHPVPCDCHLTKCILIKAHLQKMDMT